MTRFLIAILCLCGSIAPDFALAGTVHVPDDFPTVTSAIASGADTVLVREGTYVEVPVVERNLVLRGIGIARRPRLDGLAINNRFASASSVSGIDISNTVQYTTAANKSPIRLALSDCSMDGLLVGADDPDAHCSLTLSRCRLGYVAGGLDDIVMEADTVGGGVSLHLWSHAVAIQHCWFRGPSGAAIQISGEPWGTISYNRIENYTIGISATEAGLTVSGNVISGCGTAMRLESVSDGFIVTENEIRSCGTGVFMSGGYLKLVDNTIVGAAGQGVLAYPGDSFFAEGNVVGDCGGAGMHVEWDPWTYYGGVLRSNTFFRCGGSALELRWYPTNTTGVVSVENNIGFGSGGWGLLVSGTRIQHACNDWFGNRAGAVSGVAPDTTDLSVDPQFCDVGSGDVRLDAASPLAAAPGCGPIGALGVGCGARLEMVTVEPEGRGALVRWRFGLFAPALTWLERKGEAAGSWERLVGEPTKDGQAYRVVDEGVEPGLGYWYRIGWLDSEGLETGYSSPVSYRSPSVSRLFPNPSAGPVSIEWTLESAADVEVRVFDLAGRRVATLASGRFEPGRGSARWDGLQSNGTSAPAGWYVVRVRGGTIDSAHRLLLLR